MKSFMSARSVVLIAAVFSASTFAMAASAGPAGTYQYAEKNFNGTMKVSAISECTVNPQKLGCMSSSILAAEISTAYSDGSDCDLKAIENASARMVQGAMTEVLFSAKKDDNSVVSFTVVFSPKGATIKKIEQGDLVGICGMRGSILGKWKRGGK